MTKAAAKAKERAKARAEAAAASQALATARVRARKYRPIATAIKAALVARGWGLVPRNDVVESTEGLALEFIHPSTGARLPWTEAVLIQHFDLEDS